MKVINLIGGPCCGKSTVASGLFYKLKLAGYKVELVSEYTKGLVYDDNFGELNDQLKITAHQHHELHRLKNKNLDYVIMDCSLLNGIIYPNNFSDKTNNSLKYLIFSLYHDYENLSYFLPRKANYDTYGRQQTLEQAKIIDENLKSFLKNYSISYTDLTSCDITHDEIPDYIMKMDIGKLR